MKITRYKVTTWLDKITNEPMYGIKLFVDGKGWHDFAENGKAVLSYSRETIEQRIKELKADREKTGFHVARLVTS